MLQRPRRTQPMARRAQAVRQRLRGTRGGPRTYYASGACSGPGPRALPSPSWSTNRIAPSSWVPQTPRMLPSSPRSTNCRAATIPPRPIVPRPAPAAGRRGPRRRPRSLAHAAIVGRHRVAVGSPGKHDDSVADNKRRRRHARTARAKQLAPGPVGAGDAAGSCSAGSGPPGRRPPARRSAQRRRLPASAPAAQFQRTCP